MYMKRRHESRAALWDVQIDAGREKNVIRKSQVVVHLCSRCNCRLVYVPTSFYVCLSAERTVALTEPVAITLKDNHELKALSYDNDAEAGNIGIASSTLFLSLPCEERFMRTHNRPQLFPPS